MITSSFNDIIRTTDRHKLYIIFCLRNDMQNLITFLQTLNINTINMGKELSKYIEGLENYNYLNIEVLDYVKMLMDKHKSKVNNIGNDVIAICNLGILIEPILELNAVQLLKEYSKITSVIIIWENESDRSQILNWNSQTSKYDLIFSDTQIKELQYEI